MSAPNHIETIKQRVEEAFCYYQETVSDFLPRRSHNEGLKEHLIHSSIIHSFCEKGYRLYPEFPLPAKPNLKRSWGSLDLLIINKEQNFAVLCEWKRLYCSESVGQSIQDQVARMEGMSATGLFKAIDSDINSDEECQRGELCRAHKKLMIYCLWIFISPTGNAKEWFFGRNDILGKTPFTNGWECKELDFEKKSGVNKQEKIPAWLYAVKALTAAA